jgi:membrane-associated protein
VLRSAIFPRIGTDRLNERMRMLAAHPLAVNLLSAHSLLSSFGALGIFVVLFAETGLLIGIFLPGDSLLFTAGLLCTTAANNQLHLSLAAVLIAAISGALLGAQVGYQLGRTAGPALVGRAGKPRLATAMGRGREELERYGAPKAIVLARFIPIVRTVMNPLAGAIGVAPRTFLIWQAVGGIAWSGGVTLAGYLLGSHIPSIDTYLLPIVAAIVVLSLVPIALELRRTRSGRRQ